jgi:hypothetical protein
MKNLILVIATFLIIPNAWSANYVFKKCIDSEGRKINLAEEDGTKIFRLWDSRGRLINEAEVTYVPAHKSIFFNHRGFPKYVAPGIVFEPLDICTPSRQSDPFPCFATLTLENAEPVEFKCSVSLQAPY